MLSIYEQNKPRFGATPKDQALARIRDVLGQRAQAERKAAFEKELRVAARVAVRLEPAARDRRVPDGAPSTGPASAPVTIVEFTDYQCPYCHRAQNIIDQILTQYAGKVRLVHLDFPLDGHPRLSPRARRLVRGRAGQVLGVPQEPHVRVGRHGGGRPPGPGRRAEARLRCLRDLRRSDRHDAAIQGAVAGASRLGVTGTPGYFINGRMLSGARPIEQLPAGHRRRARRPLAPARRRRRAVTRSFTHSLWTSAGHSLNSTGAAAAQEVEGKLQTELRAWTVKDSIELYNVSGWGRDFFSINEAGNVEVTPAGPGLADDRPQGARRRPPQPRPATCRS